MGLSGAVSDIEATAGGVAFSGRLPLIYQANLHLRTPVRILMRIGSFKAGHLVQLQRKLADWPWELYLPAGAEPSIRVSTRRSRLYHSGAIRERFLSSITSRLAGGSLQASVSGAPVVFVRAVENHFVVSVDSSGRLLYKRGIKTHRGRAPIRENLAAAALMRAGYTGDAPLMDPMCGSGTFALEALLLARNIPPGWFRDFAFMKWPSFQPCQWDYMKRKAAARIGGPPRAPIWACDRDPTAVTALKSCLAACGQAGNVRVRCRDFFDVHPVAGKAGAGLVVVNPPFGRRLGKAGDGARFFQDVCRKLALDYRGWKVILLTPSATAPLWPAWPLSRCPVVHGGLKLTMLIGRIPP
jgi:putative N6-adenine-specific DNA methylase